ncbi:MAG: hypothetical protein MN733_16500, partial [Nitrososphaera sp.]|nr:hypothetical protein [Nitrososphaera sp.]
MPNEVDERTEEEKIVTDEMDIPPQTPYHIEARTSPLEDDQLWDIFKMRDWTLNPPPNTDTELVEHARKKLVNVHLMVLAGEIVRLRKEIDKIHERTIEERISS